MLDVRPVWVIQDRRSGLFLTDELGWSSSLSRAGRLYDVDEALDTAFDNSEPGEFEMHSFYEKA